MRASDVIISYGDETKQRSKERLAVESDRDLTALIAPPPKTGQSITYAQRLALEKTIHTSIQGVPVASKEFHADLKDLPEVFNVKCREFDLSNEQHRIDYGDLTARFLNGVTDAQLLWERQIESAGKLIIYVSYREWLRVDNKELKAVEKLQNKQ